VFAVAAAVTLVFGSAGFGAGAASAAQFEVSVDSIDALSGLTAVVANSDDGVNFRTDPSQDSDVIETLPDGTVVALRIDEVDTVYGDDDIRWWPVRYNGSDGWIAGLYLADADRRGRRRAERRRFQLGRVRRRVRKRQLCCCQHRRRHRSQHPVRRRGRFRADRLDSGR
jgi:hypothetical protein